jgi:bifunctional DNA-binding transcriptional regulator/antitoxin component of YhaV-PrlF toxin-antitoxin module
MSHETDETVRETITIQPDGRTTIPDKIREHLQIKGQKAFCEIETYGKDKAVIRVMTRWTPNKRGPGKDVVKR